VAGDLDAYRDGLDLATRGQSRAALSRLVPFTMRHPTHFMGWFARGVCHQDTGQYAEAVAAFTACVALRPDSSWAYKDRGQSRLKQGWFDLAEDDFTRALELSPAWTAALIDRAVAREGRQDWAGAERDLTAALARPDAPTRLYFFRAKVRRSAGDKAGAARDAADGLKRQPADAVSWVTRGAERMDADPHGALADFDEALALDPRSRDALQDKAVVLADYLDRPRDAVAAMDRLLDLYPHHVEARAGRGVYLARLGDAARAKQDAADCLAEEPTPFRFFQMAGLYAQLTKHDPAGPAKGDALRLLAEAFRNGYDDFALVNTDPDLDPVRRDPGFKAVVEHAQALRTAR
jgi:tetratricopeptide (TPR) repeat protein